MCRLIPSGESSAFILRLGAGRAEGGGVLPNVESLVSQPKISTGPGEFRERFCAQGAKK